MRHHVRAFARAAVLAGADLALPRFEEGGGGPEESREIRELVGEGDAVFVVEAAVKRVDRGIGYQAAGGA